MKQPTQEQMFYATGKRNAELNLQFLEFVRDGLTRQELQKCIDRRPGLWGRWSNWLNVLPGKEEGEE